MIAQLMHIDSEDRVVLCAARNVAGGALRLTHRALETHSRDVGYEIGAWIDDTLLTAAVELAREQARGERWSEKSTPGRYGGWFADALKARPRSHFAGVDWPEGGSG